MTHRITRIALALVAAALSCPSAVAAQVVARADFTDAAQVQRWKALNGISGLRATSAGMRIDIAGDDPYLAGPRFDLPPGAPLWLTVRIRSERGGELRVFPYTDATGAVEATALSASVPPGEWRDVRLPLPPQAAGTRLRIDPPGSAGTAVVASIVFERRVVWDLPKWPEPDTRAIEPGAPSLRSGSMEVRHGGRSFGNFQVLVDDRPIAVGHAPALVGYLDGDPQPRWARLDARPTVEARGGAVVESVALRDAGGAAWSFRRTFAPSKLAGAVDVRVDVTVSRDRDVVFLPLLVMLPGAGAGSFGAGKHQALLAGLEYLETDEPSSSEADVVGPTSNRRVPDALKLTFPLMAVNAGSRCVGLTWERQADVSALFDSPDRTFGSRAHAMGLIFPGSDGGSSRIEGSVLPHVASRLNAGMTFTLRATILGGAGESVIPAVEKYLKLRGLPPVPDLGMTAQQYYALAAAGWTDSRLREGDLVRHAVWPGHDAQPAADAAVWMKWLARQADDPKLAARLDASAAAVIARVEPAQYDAAAVAHVRYPALASLVFGHVEPNAAAAGTRGHELLRKFEPDGSLPYRPPADKPDLGRTHFEREANGLAAPVVASVLECASVSGDERLRRAGLRLLRGLDRYDGRVPRGAQTWEVPLHTPDVLAAAHLVRAYLLGYELTGDERYLRRARYWAWTGVPFVYLENPTSGPVGAYASIAVYGATNWTAPVWLGQPVQWCGLVYADALHRLARYDRADAPWKRLADGLAASGVQQSWPKDDAARQGLLPDYFKLRDQVREGPAINPGTVQASAIRLFGGPEIYDRHTFVPLEITVHAPGAIVVDNGGDDSAGARFQFTPWTGDDCYLLVAGRTEGLKVLLDDRPADAHAIEQSPSGRRLIVRVKGDHSVAVELRP